MHNIPKDLRCWSAFSLTVKNNGVAQVDVDDIFGCNAESRRCVHVEMEPRTILVLVRGPVEEHHLTLVPSLIGLADVRQVKGGGSVGRVRWHARHSALVALAAVRRVTLVPNVDRDFLALQHNLYIRLGPDIRRVSLTNRVLSRRFVLLST